MIDGGKPFDWGRTSEDYAKYRDIYPREFYEKIFSRRLCVDGQRVLDLGTGTGVIPRNMYEYGAKWTGIDISEKQKRRQSACPRVWISTIIRYPLRRRISLTARST